jgi:hypothetical protein
MRATVYLVDGGVRATLRSMGRLPAVSTTPGLREVRGLIAVPLGTRVPQPQLGRLGLVAFWDDDAAIDAFLAGDSPLTEALAGGWSARLEPLRAVPEARGHFPGVPTDLPRGPDDGATDAPVAVLTIGLLRRPRLVPFLRASRRAERQAHGASGFLWGTALVNPGQAVVSTFSLWESSSAAASFARSATGHTRAMAEDGKETFHRAGSFVRFRPYAVTGSLTGRNPLPATVTASLAQPASTTDGG